MAPKSLSGLANAHELDWVPFSDRSEVEFVPIHHPIAVGLTVFNVARLNWVPCSLLDT